MEALPGGFRLRGGYYYSRQKLAKEAEKDGGAGEQMDKRMCHGKPEIV